MLQKILSFTSILALSYSKSKVCVTLLVFSDLHKIRVVRPFIQIKLRQLLLFIKCCIERFDYFRITFYAQ